MTDDAPVLLDVSRLIWRRWRGWQPTGVDRVCLAYLRHFAPHAQAVIQHQRFRAILDREASAELFTLLDGREARFKARLTLGALRNFGQWSDHGRGRPYLNIGHTGLNSPGFPEWIRAADVKPIYLVHDLIPITHPEFCRSGEDAKHRQRMRTVLMTAAGVIGNSQATLDELANFADAERLPFPRAVAAWLGSEPLPVPKFADTRHPTFVTVGTIEARKNHLLLLQVWSRIIDRLGSSAPQLLVIGQRGWEAQPVFDLLDHSKKLRGRVMELNHCSDEELGTHLASARALLFPSLAEGYGLPLIEALGLGTPVIASDLPVFQEIGAGIPALLPPLDIAAWEDAVLSFSQGRSAAREKQLQHIKSFRLPDWDGHFEKVEHWLATLGLTP